MGQRGWQERDDFGGQCLRQRQGRGRTTQSANTEPAHIRTRTHMQIKTGSEKTRTIYTFTYSFLSNQILLFSTSEMMCYNISRQIHSSLSTLWLEFMQIYEDNLGWPDWNVKWNVGKRCHVTTEERFFCFCMTTCNWAVSVALDVSVNGLSLHVSPVKHKVTNQSNSWFQLIIILRNYNY